MQAAPTSGQGSRPGVACGRLLAGSVALTLAGLAVIIMAQYPLPIWPLAAAVCAYVVALWRWPALFLIVLPIVIPAYDLGLWTGWMMIGEQDLFVLATIAVLLVRSPPTARDFHVAGAAGFILLAFTASWVIATSIGRTSPLGELQSDNPFLRPDNALRLAKSLAAALALLPFLRQRQRNRGDAVTVFGWGMAAGLVVVALIVVIERILFAGILDFSTAYRVAGPFSSMRVGGGHIGAYAAMALPFSLTLVRLRPRGLGIVLALLATAGGGYTIVVTFARAAYAACLLGMAVTATAWTWLSIRNHIRLAAAGVLPIALVAASVLATAGLTGMQARFAASAADFLTRQDNWHKGLAVRDDAIPATIFGMGLGTYQRAMLQRSPVNRPTDLVLRQDSAGPYVSMRVESLFFLGQKIALPSAGAMNLTLRARSPDGPATLESLICDKVLLYSDKCRGLEISLANPAGWATIHATIPSDGLGSRAVFGLLRRPVELSLSGPPGHTIEVRDISLTDNHGNPLLVNGDFIDGLGRWIFTDDSHVSWRMLNVYLMLFFETGLLGVIAYAALAIMAMSGGIRVLRQGDLAGAAVAGAVAAFLVSGLFDNVLEAPRVATLFFLVCLCGLIGCRPDYAARNSTTSASHS